MWFDKKNPFAVFCDKRVVDPMTVLCDGRHFECTPDVVADFTCLPFEDKAFKLVVMDPPHLVRAGEKSYMGTKYGILPAKWPQIIHDGFWECMRVLDDYGVLIFKWCETQIATRKIIDCIGCEPLFGHRSGKKSNTHWMVFMKGVSDHA